MGMQEYVLVVFILVYLGMFLGGLPGLALDRAGVAVLGAILLLAGGAVAPRAGWSAVDVPTLGLLFGLMIVSAQLRLGGFYTMLTRKIAGADLPPHLLLAVIVLAGGSLSALLANDIICLAMTPILLEGCLRRGLDPVPFLLALACAANVGSAATLIGNPQNMLIGQMLELSFSGYFLDAIVPSGLGLVAVWAIIGLLYRGKWTRASEALEVESPPFSPWQTGKGLLILTVLVLFFLALDWPREILALTAAGVLLLSRKLTSRSIFALIDWQLLLLFFGLFVVNFGLAQSGLLDKIFGALRETGVDLGHGGVLFLATVVLSNLISNVPAVMLLLPAGSTAQSGLILALASTLAGNLLLVGSIANLIVAESAGRLGVPICWRTHLRAGLPVTAATLSIAGAWLWLRWDSLAVLP
jgi:Na+/H+ antiporter NhaD/arsenite permease-like protein